MKKIAFVLCGFVTCVASANASAQDTLTLPVFPVWQRGAHERCEDSRPSMSAPSGTAVLIAPDYLVANSVAFDAVDDILLDPGVCLLDGFTQTYVTGRIVDSSVREGLVLIRADWDEFKVPPASLAKRTDAQDAALNAQPWTHVRFPPQDVTGKDWRPKLQTQPIRRCDPDWDKIGPVGSIHLPMRGFLCAMNPMPGFIGSAVFTENLEWVGMLTVPDTFRQKLPRGPSLPVIRAFVESYFQSWGRWLKDKPAF